MRAAPSVLFLLTAMAVAAPAAATDPPPSSADSNGAKAEARVKYAQGVELVKSSQWSDALVAFEAAAKLYPNASITLNIGACERALGRYVRARSTLQRALDEAAATPGSLPDSSVVEAKGFIAEIDRVLARATVTVEPPEAAIAVDGRPLAELEPTPGADPIVAAGVLPPGPGRAAPARQFVLVLDPGAHVITLARKGYTDVVVNRSFAPGSSTSLVLELDRLPATLRVTSSQAGSIVRVNDADVGPAPVDVLRPAGSYRVLVQREGFVPYSTQVTVKAGEEVKLRASLVVDEPSVLSRWWFWTGAAAVVAGGVAITYAATRPEPQPPPYDGGSTGWLVSPSPAGLRF